MEIATLFPRLFHQRSFGNEANVYDITNVFADYSFLIFETQESWKKTFDCDEMIYELDHILNCG